MLDLGPRSKPSRWLPHRRSHFPICLPIFSFRKPTSAQRKSVINVCSEQGNIFKRRRLLALLVLLLSIEATSFREKLTGHHFLTKIFCIVCGSIASFGKVSTYWVTWPAYLWTSMNQQFYVFLLDGFHISTFIRDEPTWYPDHSSWHF